MGPSYEPGQTVYARGEADTLEAGAPVVIAYVFFSQTSHVVSYIVRDAQKRYLRVREDALAPTPASARRS